MSHSTKSLQLCLCLFLLILLGACGGRSASTSFYVLDSGETTPVIAFDNISEQDDMPKIQLRSVDIPNYLDRNSIVTRESGGVRLHIASFDSWAESLDSGSKRVIAEVLTPLLLEKGVLLQPLDDDSLGPWKIAVQIQRFDGTLGQDVVLDARFTVYDRYDVTYVSGAFVDKAPAGITYASLVQAQSDLLKKFATSMATPITKAMSSESDNEEENTKEEVEAKEEE